MPTIPGGGEAQVLTAGSPVPVASSENARLQGEADARLGQAMFALGDALDTAARQAKSRQKQIDLFAAMGELDLAKLQYRAETFDPSTGGDPYKNVGIFVQRTKDKAQEISERINDPEVRAEFLAKADIQLANDGVPVLAQEIQKYEKEGSLVAKAGIDNRSAMAGIDPTLTGKLLYEVDDFIGTLKDIPEHKRLEFRRNAHREIVEASIDSFVNGSPDGKRAPNYTEAKHNLNVVYAHLFTPEERMQKTKAIDAIKEERMKDEQELQDRQRKIAKELREEDMNRMTESFMAQMIDAPNERARELVYQDAAVARSSGLLEDAHLKALKSYQKDLFTDRVDAAQTLVIFDRISSGELSFRQAQREVLETVKAGEMSGRSAVQTWKYLREFEQRTKTDPLFMKRANAGADYVKTLGKPQDVFDKMMGTNPVLAKQSQDALQSYWKMIQQGVDPNTARDRAIGKNYGEHVVRKVIPGIKYDDGTSDEKLKYQVMQDIQGKPDSYALPKLRALKEELNRRAEDKKRKEADKEFKAEQQRLKSQGN